MEQYILIIKTRILWMVGVGWIAVGLYLGYDPVVVTLRGAFAAVVAMIVSGMLLRLGGKIIAEQLQKVAAAEAAAAKDSDA